MKSFPAIHSVRVFIIGDSVWYLGATCPIEPNARTPVSKDREKLIAARDICSRKNMIGYCVRGAYEILEVSQAVDSVLTSQNVPQACELRLDVKWVACYSSWPIRYPTIVKGVLNHYILSLGVSV